MKSRKDGLHQERLEKEKQEKDPEKKYPDRCEDEGRRYEVVNLLQKGGKK